MNSYTQSVKNFGFPRLLTNFLMAGLFYRVFVRNGDEREEIAEEIFFFIQISFWCLIWDTNPGNVGASKNSSLNKWFRISVSLEQLFFFLIENNFFQMLRKRRVQKLQFVRLIYILIRKYVCMYIYIYIFFCINWCECDEIYKKKN